jgi:hypothetical protein
VEIAEPWKASLGRLVERVRVVRAAYPDRSAMAAVDLGVRPPEPQCQKLWEEAVLLRGGLATTTAALEAELHLAEVAMAAT